jgi:hypothetical protein
MSDCSIHPSTPEKWIASMQDSLARTLALLESRQEYLREPDQVFTVKSCALLASFDRDTCSWKTLQQSFLTDSEPFSQTWPRWGMTAGGFAYEHPMSGRRITETDFSCLPTPRASDGFAWTRVAKKDVQKSISKALVRFGDCRAIYQYMWIGFSPTQTAEQLGMMMGYPKGYASLKESATESCRCKPQPHGDCLEAIDD